MTVLQVNVRKLRAQQRRARMGGCANPWEPPTAANVGQVSADATVSEPLIVAQLSLAPTVPLVYLLTETPSSANVHQANRDSSAIPVNIYCTLH